MPHAMMAARVGRWDECSASHNAARHPQFLRHRPPQIPPPNGAAAAESDEDGRMLHK